MLDLSRIKAIGLDLDDTLWPIWPVITRAEAQMLEFLQPRAPGAAAVFADPVRRQAVRAQVVRDNPDLSHNMSVLRLESIRSALRDNGEDVALAEAAFDVFFECRMQVRLYDDALPALARLAARYPIVAVSNGNADIHRVGIGRHFAANMSAHVFGVGKPDVRIFHAAARAAGVAPHEVLHVGDDPELDVLGGLGAGMQTVWVNRGGHAWQHAQQPHASVTDLQQLCELLARSD
ncbi:MAG: HAD-IA family hydrolase [Rhodoferax sp.]|nr:HAD-IA family hydrolase [Rhodoferax sp.]MCW5628003.1 HAD-IA family hydrolase [Rhodoferax sp.]